MRGHPVLSTYLHSLSESGLQAWIAVAPQAGLRRLNKLATSPCVCDLVPAQCPACAQLRDLVLGILAVADDDGFELCEVLERTAVRSETAERVLERLIAAKVLQYRRERYWIVGSIEKAQLALKRRWRCDCPVVPLPCTCGLVPEMELSAESQEQLRLRLDDYADPPMPPTPSVAYSQRAMAEVMAVRRSRGFHLYHQLDAVQALNANRARKAKGALSVTVNRRRNGSPEIQDLQRG